MGLLKLRSAPVAWIAGCCYSWRGLAKEETNKENPSNWKKVLSCWKRINRSILPSSLRFQVRSAFGRLHRSARHTSEPPPTISTTAKSTISSSCLSTPQLLPTLPVCPVVEVSHMISPFLSSIFASLRLSPPLFSSLLLLHLNRDRRNLYLQPQPYPHPHHLLPPHSARSAPPPNDLATHQDFKVLCED